MDWFSNEYPASASHKIKSLVAIHSMIFIFMKYYSKEVESKTWLVRQHDVKHEIQASSSDDLNEMMTTFLHHIT